ncbi:hypothetical protein BaRGS_00022324 [Batillaria attramentaria]|uniref:Direct IAP-binding protein with low pI n=1 Tax=Batillaria attramentaria TaxID=370345 RepID=A0ABD0KHD3_9CAEN
MRNCREGTLLTSDKMALYMVNRRLLAGCQRCGAFISARIRNVATNNPRIQRRRCFVTGSALFAYCQSRNKLDLPEPDPGKLTQEYLLKSSSARTADSVSAILSQTARALIDAEEKYREVVKALIQLTEHHLTVLGSVEEEHIWDVILEARQRAEKFNERRKDLDLLFSCVQKLVDSSAEVAFLTGANFSSTSLGERLHNAQRHVDSAKAESHRAEEDLRKVQAKSVKIIADHAEAEKKRKKDENDDNWNEDKEIIDLFDEDS